MKRWLQIVIVAALIAATLAHMAEVRSRANQIRVTRIRRIDDEGDTK